MEDTRDIYLKGVLDERTKWEKKIKQKLIELKNEKNLDFKKYGENILNDLLKGI